MQELKLELNSNRTVATIILFNILKIRSQNPAMTIEEFVDVHCGWAGYAEALSSATGKKAIDTILELLDGMIAQEKEEQLHDTTTSDKESTGER